MPSKAEAANQTDVAEAKAQAVKMNVAVLVLGDVGRSPRMQFHAVSLAKQDWVEQISLVGTQGSACIAGVQEQDKIQEIRLAESITAGLPRKFLLLYAPVKIVEQIAQLLVSLVRIPDLDVVLVQNPPCIPTFLVLALLRLIRGTRVVIDWHNLGFTILALSFRTGTKHPAVRGARLYEELLGRWIGDAHLCVTSALKQWLEAEFSLSSKLVSVLYDKPPAIFRPLEIQEQHQFWQRLGNSISDGQGNIFTTKQGRDAVIRKDRPALIVSSTSWTPDEDFGILLAALATLDKDPSVSSRGIICVVTGKGPQRDMYMDKVKSLGLKHVSVRSVWLEHADYPLLLSCMDLGVCLHTSSSGLDLPMKVVDMFGAGLPVCAVDYPCLDELVQHGENGLVFRTETELADQMKSVLFEDGSEAKLKKLRQGVANSTKERWDAYWEANAAPAIQGLGKKPFPMFWVLCFFVFIEAIYLCYTNFYHVPSSA